MLCKVWIESIWADVIEICFDYSIVLRKHAKLAWKRPGDTPFGQCTCLSIFDYLPAISCTVTAITIDFLTLLLPFLTWVLCYMTAFQINHVSCHCDTMNWTTHATNQVPVITSLRPLATTMIAWRNALRFGKWIKAFVDSISVDKGIV